MKGHLMVRLITLLVLVGIGLTHFTEQTNLLSANWLWLAILPAFMGFQATFTGWCPAELIGKLSRTGECCSEGTCSTQPVKKQNNPSSCCSNSNEQKSEAFSSDCSPTSETLVVQVLGTGCSGCNSTVKLIETVALENALDVTVIKVEDLAKIASYGVMSTPAVVIDEKIVHSGGIPSRNLILKWLSK